MAISQTVLTNRLDKKVNYGKARTAFDAQKGPINEAIASPLSQGTHQFWVQSEQIPALSPSTTTSIVGVYQYAASGTNGIIEMTKDPTVSSGRAYLACSTLDDTSTLLQGWIPTTYGATYDAKFFIGPTGHHGNTDYTGINGFSQIFPSTSGEEWYFDYDSGVFAFAGDNIPSALSGKTVYMTKGFRYVGLAGLTNFTNPNQTSLLTVKEINDPSTNVSVGTVEEIQFDVDSGFALTDLGNNKVKIAMESTFKHWNVAGQDSLVATAVDQITVAQGDGITLTTTAPPTSTQVYYVKFSGGKYIFEDADGAVGNGTAVTSFNFVASGTYKFDTSNATLTSSQFEFSTTADGTHNSGTIFTNGVSYGESGGSRIADGTAGSFLQLKAKNDTTATLYDFNADSGGTGDGSTATFSAQQKTLTIKNSLVDSSGNVTVTGNLVVHGATTTVNSTTTTLDDPVITLGGDDSYILVDDNKDRGVEFKWNDGSSDVAATAIVSGTEYIIKTAGDTDWTTLGSTDSVVGTKFTANANGTGSSGTGTAILATAANVGFFGLDDSSGKFTFIPDGTNTSEIYSGDVGIFDLSNTGINEVKDVNVGTPGSSEDGKVLTWDNTSSKFLLATPGQSGLTLGAATDGTFNDGAYYQKNTTAGGGTWLTGLETTGTVADALDAINETIKNIKLNKYVQGSTFTVSPAAGGGSPAAPLNVRFTIADKGDATHADWTFENTDTGTTINVNDSQSTLTNGYIDQAFNEIAGGNVDVTMTLKCAAGATSGMTEGSYVTYKKVGGLTLYTPDPEPSWTTTSNDTVVDLDSSSAADRQIEFDTSSSLYTKWWMIEFGDGSKYPTAADPTETNNDIVSGVSGSAAWISWDTTKKYIHDYNASSTYTQDTRFSPKVYCRSLTARGDVGHTVALEKANHIKGYVTPVPAFTVQGLTTGNNDRSGDTNANGDTNAQEGHPVKFTNTTPDLGTWGDTSYTWTWGTGQGSSTTTGGGGGAGDVSVQIENYFDLAVDGTEETFNVTLTATNGSQNSPVVTAATVITTKVDPRADFTAAFVNQNTSANGSPSYVNSLVGFDFTKYDPSAGGQDSSGPSKVIQFTNASDGVTIDGNSNLTTVNYTYDFGDSSATSTASSPTHTYQNATGSDIQRSPSLIAATDNSYGGGASSTTDSVKTRTNYVTIKPAPSAPAGLTGYTHTIPTSYHQGISPKICANTTDNTVGNSAPTGGTTVVRVETQAISTDELSGWANEFPSNGNYSGTLTAHVNESVADNGQVEFTGANKVARYDDAGATDSNGLLEVTQEQDANAADSSTYPDNFYKQYKAKVHVTSSLVSAGYNTIQLKHTDTTESDKVGFVYDDMQDNPAIAAFGAVTENTGTYRTMSGVKFYTTGSSLTVTGLQISKLTGRTYRGTTTPLTVDPDTGTAIASQTYSYTDLGLNAVPDQNVGVSAALTSSALTVSVNGSGSGDDATLKASAINVNGGSPEVSDTTKIMYWFTSPTLDENAIPLNITMGGAVSGATVCKRVKYAWPTTNAAYPDYSGNASSDFYTAYTWNSTTDNVLNTNEAPCYLDAIRHSMTDYSTGYLPAGINMSTGRTATDTQYFTFAFKRTGLAKMGIKISGEVTSLYIAIPGYTTDSTSSLNGWLDCSTNFGGSGFPGANTGNGGNGSNGVRRLGGASDQGSFAVNTALTNAYANLDLGTANTGSAPNPTVLVRFGLAQNKTVTAISIEDWG
tara:strand:- start:3121 stop:8295 length:5175 start_codon:yes stop_codon:yes gene_type:complete